MTFPKEVLDRAAGVRLFLSDVDGVWTDGRVTVHADGTESVTFSIQDGLGVVRLKRAGIELALVSGRANPAVDARARRLGLEHIHLGVADKGALVDRMLEERGLKPEQVAAIGDDLPDLEMFDRAGLRLAPPHAVPEVRERADWVTRAAAGAGCLREACDLLLAARDGAQAT